MLEPIQKQIILEVDDLELDDTPPSVTNTQSWQGDFDGPRLGS